jgi:hypothetical protein
MGFIQDIKNFAGNYSLSQEVKSLKRNKTFLNLEEAKTIGIVFDATANEDFETVKKYISSLKELKKRVKAIGFFNMKESPPMAYSKLEYDFFTLKDLSWNNIPKSIYVKNFIEEQFDILLDLNMNETFPLKYISSLSRARFKVGKSTKWNSSIFDLMLDINSARNLKYFLKNLDTYLFIINKKHDNTIIDS